MERPESWSWTLQGSVRCGTWGRLGISISISISVFSCLALPPPSPAQMLGAEWSAAMGIRTTCQLPSGNRQTASLSVASTIPNRGRRWGKDRRPASLRPILLLLVHCLAFQGIWMPRVDGIPSPMLTGWTAQSRDVLLPLTNPLKSRCRLPLHPQSSEAPPSTRP